MLQNCPKPPSRQRIYTPNWLAGTLRRSTKAISTSIVAIVIIVILIGSGVAVYFASQNTKTQTVTVSNTSITGTSIVSSSSSSSAQSSGSIPANTLVIGVTSPEWGTDAIDVDPDDSIGANVGWSQMNYESLYQMNPVDIKDNGTYVPIPWLATNATESANGLTYVINLRANVHFHTGNVMTARDVQWSFDRALFFNLTAAMISAPGGGWTSRSYFTSMENVSVSGPLQVTFTLFHPDPLFYQELASEALPILDSTVLQSHAVMQNGTSDLGYTWLSTYYTSDVGTGPFVMTNYIPEQRAQFANFPGYWGGPYGVNTTVTSVTFIPIADATTAGFELEKGQINVLMDATPSVLSSLEGAGGYGIIHSPTFEDMNLEMHVVGPLSDWRVRSALMEAIDYQGIISAVTFGLDTIDNSEFLQGMQGWTNATATYWENHENITNAKALLAQAGYANGFSVTLYTRPGSRYGVEFDTLSQILVSDWAQIGVTTTIEVYEVGQFYQLDYNQSLPGIWTEPNSLGLFSAASNLDSTLFPSSTINGWNAHTETGPGINFTYLDDTYNESLADTNATQSVQLMQQVDAYYTQYGQYHPIIQSSLAVAYASDISGMVWNSYTDMPDPTYLSVN